MSETEEPRFNPAYWAEVPIGMWLEATTAARINGGEKVPYKLDVQDRVITFYWSRDPEHREEIAVLTCEGRCYLNIRFFEPHIKFLMPEAAH